MNQDELNKKLNDEHQSRRDAYKTVFSGPAGWRVFKDLLVNMEFWETDGNISDSARAYGDGKKAVINHIVNRLVEAEVVKSKEDLLKPIFIG